MSTAIPKQNRKLFEFGPFQLDPGERILARAGERIPLAPKAFDTLVILVEQRGHMLSKDELMKAIWPDSFVEENNLTQNISALRKALGENPGQQYIETVPRLGYRFVAQVREVPAAPRELTAVEQFQSNPPAEVRLPQPSPADISDAAILASTLPKRRWITGPAAVSAFLLLFVAVATYLYFVRSRNARSSQVNTPARESVAILGFRNLSANHDDDWLSTAFAEMLTTDLASGERFRAVSGEDIARMKVDTHLTEIDSLSRATLTKVRKSLGADFTVSGSYVKIGEASQSRIRLDLQVQDTAKGEIVGSVSEVGLSSELFELVSRSGDQLRAKLGAPIPSSTQ